MSSEPSERAKAWTLDAITTATEAGREIDASDAMRAFDAGHSEGEKKGTAVGYLAALQEVRPMAANNALTARRVSGNKSADLWSDFRAWLDRRIREAEEKSHAVSL